jgi:hypothetical protein
MDLIDEVRVLLRRVAEAARMVAPTVGEWPI